MVLLNRTSQIQTWLRFKLRLECWQRECEWETRVALVVGQCSCWPTSTPGLCIKLWRQCYQTIPLLSYTFKVMPPFKCWLNSLYMRCQAVCRVCFVSYSHTCLLLTLCTVWKLYSATFITVSWCNVPIQLILHLTHITQCILLRV